MIHLPYPDCLGLYSYWSHALTNLVEGQCRLLDAQSQLGIELLDALRGHCPAGAPGPQHVAGLPTATHAAGLAENAARRARAGLAPPREIYDVQNRAQLDWLGFPAWARPSDPELFGDSPHEG